MKYIASPIHLPAQTLFILLLPVIHLFTSKRALQSACQDGCDNHHQRPNFGFFTKGQLFSGASSRC
jgi:hypothetical protein